MSETLEKAKQAMKACKAKMPERRFVSLSCEGSDKAFVTIEYEQKKGRKTEMMKAVIDIVKMKDAPTLYTVKPPYTLCRGLYDLEFPETVSGFTLKKAVEDFMRKWGILDKGSMDALYASKCG